MNRTIQTTHIVHTSQATNKETQLTNNKQCSWISNRYRQYTGFRSLTLIYEGFNTPTQNFWIGFRGCFRGCTCSEVEQSFDRYLNLWSNKRGCFFIHYDSQCSDLVSISSWENHSQDVCDLNLRMWGIEPRFTNVTTRFSSFETH